MSEPIYNLVFRGEVLEGQHRAVVAKRLATLLKIDPGKAGTLFSGRAIVLKRNASKAVAAKYQAAFRKAGARLRITVVEGAAVAKTTPLRGSSSEAADAVPAPAAPAPAAAKAPGGKALSLAERLAAQAAELPQAASPSAAPSSLPAARARATVPASAPAAEGQLSVAPASGDLVHAHERPPIEAVEVDVSHLSAAPAESGSLEGLIAQVPPPRAPDTSAISLAELGSELVEAKAAVVASVVAPDIGLAQAGEDLETLPTPPPPPVPEVNFGVAALGAAMDTAAKPAPPPAPDVSHISLVAERARFAVPD